MIGVQIVNNITGVVAYDEDPNYKSLTKYVEDKFINRFKAFNTETHVRRSVNDWYPGSVFYEITAPSIPAEYIISEYTVIAPHKFRPNSPTPKKIIFNGPATIVFWKDGTKTVVKCAEGDTFDKETGVAMAFMKKMLGNESNYFNKYRKMIEEEE